MTMNRLNHLIQSHTFGKITLDELVELADLLIEALKDKSAEVEFFGNQLMDTKAKNALLEHKLINKRVS